MEDHKAVCFIPFMQSVLQLTYLPRQSSRCLKALVEGKLVNSLLTCFDGRVLTASLPHLRYSLCL